MKVLGIETATSICSVGLSSEQGFMAEYRLRGGYNHAEQLPAAVQNVLQGSGLNLADVDGIAVSIGPGSFTGLRIGLGLAKGLAYGSGKPLLAVPTMDALIYPVQVQCVLACVLIIARKDEVYLGLYKSLHGEWKPKGDPRIVPIEKIGEELPESEILFIGEGSFKYSEIIKQKVKKCCFIPSYYSMPSGYSVAAKGLQFLRIGHIADTNSLVPQYIKRFKGVA
jgi:tRNA threonylcarbamoyladenosine biosynthesis protein TsaB